MGSDPERSAADRISAQLSAWSAGRHAALREAYVTLLASGRGLGREDGAEHVTGSALIFDRVGRQVLLVHHAKGDFWVQPGGHWEPGDADIEATAARELAEETGLTGVSLRVHDLDRHELPGTFGSCRFHCDVLFVGQLSGELVAPELSAESKQVGWFSVDALPRGIVPDLPRRIASARVGLATG